MSPRIEIGWTWPKAAILLCVVLSVSQGTVEDDCWMGVAWKISCWLQILQGMVIVAFYGHDSWFFDTYTSEGSPILGARSTNPDKAHLVLCLTLRFIVRCWKVDSYNLSIPKLAVTHSCKRHDEGKLKLYYIYSVPASGVIDTESLAM